MVQIPNVKIPSTTIIPPVFWKNPVWVAEKAEMAYFQPQHVSNSQEHIVSIFGSITSQTVGICCAMFIMLASWLMFAENFC